MRHLHAPSPKFQLADHVRACRIDEQVLLLDMQRNRYLGIGGSQLDALSQLVVDWPCSATEVTLSSQRPATPSQLQPLLDQQLLCEVRMPRQTRSPPPEALGCIDLDADFARPSLAGRDVLRLAWAAIGASRWLRRLSLAEIATRVASLRPRSSDSDERAGTPSLRDTVFTYMRLRPFLFTAHDRCLHDSLTLIRFLATQGLFPAWVIGVRTRPFTAHSWVQSDNLVLNDAQEHVRLYTPILVV